MKKEIKYKYISKWLHFIQLWRLPLPEVSCGTCFSETVETVEMVELVEMAEDESAFEAANGVQEYSEDYQFFSLWLKLACRCCPFVLEEVFANSEAQCDFSIDPIIGSNRSIDSKTSVLSYFSHSNPYFYIAPCFLRLLYYTSSAQTTGTSVQGGYTCDSEEPFGVCLPLKFPFYLLAYFQSHSKKARYCE